jgi:hypothetical protein
MFDKSDDEIIGWLEEEKAIIWDGMDENGEAIFRFDLERLKVVMPELYTDIMADIDSDLMVLYEEGFVEIDYDEDLNARFKATPKGLRWMEESGIDFPFPN